MEFLERLMNNFHFDEPIFTNEILDLFSEYSDIYVFKMIKREVDRKTLIQYSKGIYYMPIETGYGLSNISADTVVKKKYLSYKDEQFGIYSGLTLQNRMRLTTQMPMVLEITSNNESSRKREILIKKSRYIIRKSKCEITKDNVNEYTILQLIYDTNNNGYKEMKIKEAVRLYTSIYNIKKDVLFKIANYFPSFVFKKIINGGYLDEITFK